MIRVNPKPEPSDFDTKVRQKGLQFLKDNGIVKGMTTPPKFDWNNCWTNCLEDLYDDYDEVCAYSCLHLEYLTGGCSVDHFLPKSKYPFEAYEWNNYRLCAFNFNSTKLEHEDVLDPFAIEDGWFQIDFVTGGITPNLDLDPSLISKIRATIARLHLSSIRFKKRRIQDFENYNTGKYSPSFLSRYSPFVYKEMVRQGFI